MTTYSKHDIGAGASEVTTIPDAGLKAWMSEIATLINTKPLTIIQTIELTTNKKFIGTTYGDLARAVGTLLKTNGKFQAAMVILVHLENGVISYDQVASGELDLAIPGAQYKNVGGDPITWILEAAAAVVNLTNKITTSVLNKQTAKIIAKNKATVDADKQQANEDLDHAAVESELMTIVQQKLITDAAVATPASADAGSGVGSSDSSNGLWIALIIIFGIGGVFLLSRSVGGGVKKETGGPAIAPAAPGLPEKEKLTVSR